MLRNSHILITGAQGFLGRHLCSILLATGARVTQVVRCIRPELLNQEGVIAFDLSDRRKVMENFSDLQPNYVIHLAGTKNRNDAGTQFRASFDTNLTTSLNIVEACLDLSNFKRLVFLGSCDEYGLAATPFDETQREIPINAYGLSKLAVTKMLFGLYKSRQFPSVVLRPTVIYGPDQGSEMFLSALIQTLLADNDFAMTAGEQFRDFVYVDDVVDAIIKVLVAGDQAHGAVINIGAGASCQVKNIATLVANLIHPDAYRHIKFGVVPYRQNQSMEYAANITRAKQLLGWQPMTPLEQGLQQTIRHFST